MIEIKEAAKRAQDFIVELNFRNKNFSSI